MDGCVAGGRMAGVTGQWWLRRFEPATDREQVEALWRAAMPPAWPLLAEWRHGDA